MAAAPDQVADLAEALAAQGGLKLWSLVVTVLGDLAQGGVEEVPGPVLSALVERIGLQPQAMRVALHRLKRDGWIESRREARIGYYRLSATGRAQTIAVAGRVYGPAAATAAALCLAIAPPAAGEAIAALPDEVPAFALTRQALLLPAADAPSLPEDWAVFEGGARPQPDWIRELAGVAACEEAFAALRARLLALDPSAVAEPLERLALRVLVLHGWRRLVLRSNPVAEALLGPGAAAAACRGTALSLLEALPRPDPAALGAGPE